VSEEKEGRKKVAVSAIRWAVTEKDNMHWDASPIFNFQ
jgi:hypothetical protein